MADSVVHPLVRGPVTVLVAALLYGIACSDNGSTYVEGASGAGLMGSGGTRAGSGGRAGEGGVPDAEGGEAGAPSGGEAGSGVANGGRAGSSPSSGGTGTAGASGKGMVGGASGSSAGGTSGGSAGAGGSAAGAGGSGGSPGPCAELCPEAYVVWPLTYDNPRIEIYADFTDGLCAQYVGALSGGICGSDLPPYPRTLHINGIEFPCASTYDFETSGIDWPQPTNGGYCFVLGPPPVVAQSYLQVW